MTLLFASGVSSLSITRARATAIEVRPVHGTVYAVDATDGTERWRTETASVTGQPVVTDDTVYTISHEAVRALDRESGETEWTLDDGTTDVRRHIFDQLQPRITEDNGHIYINTGTLYALTPDGRAEWEYDLVDNHSVRPTVAEGLVIACRNDIQDNNSGHIEDQAPSRYELIALDAETGNVVWSVERDSEIEIQPTVTDGVVYVEETDDVYDLETGEKRDMDAPTGEETDAADSSQSNPDVPAITIREPDTNTARTGTVIEASEDEELVWSFDTSNIKQIDYGERTRSSEWWIVHEPVVDGETVFIGCIQWDETASYPPEPPEDIEEDAATDPPTNASSTTTSTDPSNDSNTTGVTADSSPLGLGPVLTGVVGFGVLARRVLSSNDE